MVIAKAVEAGVQLLFLDGLDCGRMQGYYSRCPLPAGEFRILLESGRVLDRLAA